MRKTAAVASLLLFLALGACVPIADAKGGPYVESLPHTVTGDYVGKGDHAGLVCQIEAREYEGGGMTAPGVRVQCIDGATTAYFGNAITYGSVRCPQYPKDLPLLGSARQYSFTMHQWTPRQPTPDDPSTAWMLVEINGVGLWLYRVAEFTSAAPFYGCGE